MYVRNQFTNKDVYNGIILPNKIHHSWHPYIFYAFELDSMRLIKEKINTTNNYFPEKQNIFNVFQMPLHDIRVVILGQDPYYTGEAIGYAFAVDNSTYKTFSLTTIEKELGKLLLNNDLSDWIKQGVFLLNTALTVKQNTPGSHLSLWQEFTNIVISTIARENPCIWLLWGNAAKHYERIILQSEKYANNTNIILKAGHPASERKNSGTFLNCNHFNLVNKYLKEKKQSLINF